MDKILIIDGNSVLYRSYYALDMSKEKFTVNINEKTLYTHAVYGFIKIFLKMSKNNYKNIIVVFDKAKKTFRNDYYQEYKSNRKKMKEDIYYQLDMIKEFLQSINVMYFEKINFEADDLAGSLIKYFPNDHIYFLTSDKDFLQLINENVSILLMNKPSNILEYNSKNFSELFQLPKPKLIIDYKILSGDKSDNISKIENISEKTASILLNIFGNIDNIFSDIDSFDNKLLDYKKQNNLRINVEKIKKSLIENQKNILERFKWLPIRTDITINIDENKLNKIDLSSDQFLNFCNKYSMNSFIIENESLNSKSSIENIKDIIYLNKWDVNYNKCDNFILIQYFEEDYHTTDPLGISIINDRGKLYIPFNIAVKDKDFINFISSDKYKKYTYNIKSFLYSFVRHNIKAKGLVYDLMLAIYILNSSINNIFEYSSKQFLGKNIILNPDLIFGKGVKKIVVEEKIYSNYLVNKTIILKDTYEKVINELKKQKQYDLYSKIELPVTFVLYKMEKEGIKVDLDELQNQSSEITKKINHILVKFNHVLKDKYKINDPYNLNSPKQISDLIFNKLNIESSVNRKKLSTDAKQLSLINNPPEVIQYILEYRKLYKILSVYLKGFEKFLDSNNLIHTFYKQNHVLTGRLSSANPNLQNIVADNKVRKIFSTKSKENIFMSFDYSQIELKIIAELSNDQNLINAFKNNLDIHSEVASKLFNIEYGKETFEQRRIAKVINFGIIYGMKEFGLSQLIDKPIWECKKIIEKYFTIHKNLKNYIDDQITEAKENGYVKNILNRKRIIAESSSNNKFKEEALSRIIMNMPIQSLAADILKLSMINIQNRFTKNNLKSKLILQIHDELIIETLKSESDEVEKIVQEEMMNLSIVKNWKIKLNVNMKKGINLFDL